MYSHGQNRQDFTIKLAGSLTDLSSFLLLFCYFYFIVLLPLPFRGVAHHSYLVAEGFVSLQLLSPVWKV